MYRVTIQMMAPSYNRVTKNIGVNLTKDVQDAALKTNQ